AVAPPFLPEGGLPEPACAGPPRHAGQARVPSAVSSGPATARHLDDLSHPDRRGADLGGGVARDRGGYDDHPRSSRNTPLVDSAASSVRRSSEPATSTRAGALVSNSDAS